MVFLSYKEFKQSLFFCKIRGFSTQLVNIAVVAGVPTGFALLTESLFNGQVMIANLLENLRSQ